MATVAAMFAATSPTVASGVAAATRTDADHLVAVDRMKGVRHRRRC